MSRVPSPLHIHHPGFALLFLYQNINTVGAQSPAGTIHWPLLVVELDDPVEGPAWANQGVGMGPQRSSPKCAWLNAGGVLPTRNPIYMLCTYVHLLPDCA